MTLKHGSWSKELVVAGRFPVLLNGFGGQSLLQLLQLCENLHINIKFNTVQHDAQGNSKNQGGWEFLPVTKGALVTLTKVF